MKYRSCIIAYDHGGPITVGPWPDKTGWSDRYTYTVGAGFLKVAKQSDDENRIQVLLEFHHAVVRDGVPVKDAHRAFSAIEEYRNMMAEDVPHADIQ